MMTRNELLDLVKQGRSVTLMLTDAKIVSIKDEWKVCKNTTAQLHKIVAVDPTLGAVFFSGFSEKLKSLDFGALISLKVTVTGMGDATEKYPDPILFARPHIRGKDTITCKPGAEVLTGDVDLTVNV